ncbi:alkylation response protein AidB-like acyl-CoA dehydrogenase [Acetobacter aceti NBRC 14818]|uniref:Acyl-CoA dehydrogenase n=1 Tax=Acetobacter aceti NBRC 14818 TaxID=887700 RepID=A0AB33II16_ACEAC|nr:acyl-CoA dehydrogenase family protein [Acetobacter aceti]TCS31086.1 alkylation response protein AidB-like acyl-CoA dehydrogenase [Acetobacter aceti NBRC 14818]BCK76703.1 acyl-CoA dehydrogenase [Acetobacter aceti NBRC 14818]GAN58137.1 acyl-CoA dehydrogenase [Acetobacter aceti NBRC 14818]
MDGSRIIEPTLTEVEVPDELVRRFAERAADHDRRGEIGFDNLDDLRKAGLLALAVPRSHGGSGISLRQIARIVARVAEGDPSTALILAMQYLQTLEVAVSRTWSEDVRKEVFDSIVHSGALLNGLRVEPELGTPARGGIPATRVRREGDRWLLSGRKIFSTGSSALHWGIVWGATEEETPRIGQILVLLDSPGVRIEKSWHQLGMRATGSDTIIFEDVEVPERYLINFNESGSKPEPSILATAHTAVVAALYDAVARSARNWLIDFLNARVPTALGRPLSTLPRFHTVLGEIDGLLLTNKALLDSVFSKIEDETIMQVEAGQIKRLVTENAIAAVARAVEVTGNPGLSQNNPLERHYRNVLCGRIHTPQADAVLEAAGRTAFEAVKG